MKLYFLLFLILNSLLFPKIIFSNETNSYEFLTGISILNFGYKEFNINNILLDKEDGTIPGLTVAITRHWQDWSTNIKITNHKGIVTYTGQTNTGIPVTSKTDTNILDYSFSINRSFSTNNMNFTIYGGYGQHKWHRNIRATTTDSGTPVNGLDERYFWDYLHIGSKFKLIKEPRSKWEVDFQYRYSLNPEIEVNSVSFDPVTLKLGTTQGIFLSSPYQMQIEDQLFIKLEPYYEYWDIQRSETKKISVGSVLTNGSITEPRSETENFGINFSIVKKF